MAKQPSNQLVAWAWLATITGITPAMVDIQLPTDPTGWAATGFVQIGPGFDNRTPQVYVPIRESVIEIHTWGVNPDTADPDWQAASDLAELIVDASYRNHNLNSPLTMPKPGYRLARVTGAYPVNYPQQNLDDVASYGHYTLDLAMHWIELDE